jgi:hypothetical protein
MTELWCEGNAMTFDKQASAASRIGARHEQANALGQSETVSTERKQIQAGNGIAERRAGAGAPIAGWGRTHRGACGLSPRKPKVLPDAAHTGMWRVRWPDGRLSDMTNLTRARDAVACFMETEERRRRGRHSPSEGRLCVKTDSWGKGPAAE